MCDTICVLPGLSAGGAALLAKNSDREPNEPHVIRFLPAQTYADGDTVRCTYISVPQAQRTHAALLFKPDWIWGAEMGVNEHSVAIGNEAVFTRVPKWPGALTGMDLLRLALERSDTAAAALDTITELLQHYGQGGNCGYTKDFRYDNSFLIADPSAAYVLETAGKSYAAYEVKNRAAISNRLTIRTEHTMRRGLAEGEDFAAKFSDPLYSFFAQAKQRRAQSLCGTAQPPVSAAQLMAALRFHRHEGSEFRRADVGSVCMHAGGLIGDQTTGSFVAVLRTGAPMTVWATGASAPCIAAFKPVFFGIDSGAPLFDDESDGRQYWLKRERLHRAVIAGKAGVAALRARRDALEEKWIEEEERLFAEGAPDSAALKEFTARAAAQEQAMVDEFSRGGWADMPGNGGFARYWKKHNAALGKPRRFGDH
jgi:dipeptidase